MFTAEYFQEIQKGFLRQMRLLDERIATLSAKTEAMQPQSKEDTGNDCAAADTVSEKMLTLLIDKKTEILTALQSLPSDAAQALTYLYSAMPLSDLLDYPVSLFEAYAKHGAWLYQHGPFAGKVPERLFANYVLHHRVNNEDLVDNRSFFYAQLQKSLRLPAYTASFAGEASLCPEISCAAGISDADCKVSMRMYDAAVETNYWCAAQGTYRASDERTENPLTMYNSGTGRCGEESTFVVSALRSIGIPSRQVYVPLWSHCDDNHAWVEVWCDHEWYFLGACEPEERLNAGWFNGPASRAMLVHSRWFGQDEPLDPIISSKGMARMLNHLSRYAYTTEITVKTEDEKHHPVPGAQVRFHVLNQGNYGPVAELISGNDTSADAKAAEAVVHLTTGYGDLYVTASKDGAFGDCLISPENETVCTITLHESPSLSDTWENMDFHAPSPGFMRDEPLTDAQKAISAARLGKAAALREARLTATWQEERVAHVLAHFPESDAIKLNEILHKAKGNLPELLKFLAWDAGALVPADWEAGRRNHWKLKFLQSLREKDYKDTTAETLIDCCESALPYADTIEAPSDEIFFHFLANPRVENEMLRPCRRMLTEFFHEEAEHLKKEPQKLPAFIKSLITSLPDAEYEHLVTSPAGCLTGGIASRLSIDILCVTLYRCLGIPARLSTLDHSLQYYQGGRFLTVSNADTPFRSTDDTAKPSKSSDIDAGADKSTAQEAIIPADTAPVSAVLKLAGDHSLLLSDWDHYSVSNYQNGEFVPLCLADSPIDAEKNELTLELKPGIYRVLTTNRMPDGNQLAKQIVFSLKAEEECTLVLSLRTPSFKGNLVNYPVEELYFAAADVSDTTIDIHENTQAALQTASVAFDKHVSLAQLMEGDSDKALFMWLDVGREPTEHVLNELCDRRDAYAALKSPLYVVLNKPHDLFDPTLQGTMRALPCLKPILGLSKNDMRTLAREVSHDADSLPLTVVMKKGTTCIYSSCGYNVGITDLLLQILHT
ncbi:MAG: transglutaminase-like domain-containing protein [Lachnospiraceae bacterium]|nr:transglutaminase-like domain-containing protein [Lachnospiraceae bacterium]